MIEKLLKMLVNLQISLYVTLRICNKLPVVSIIAHIQYIKIHLETIDITTRLWGSDVYCFKLNFNISNVGYYCSIFLRLQSTDISFL